VKYALYLGCQIPARLSQYEYSARAVLRKLTVELVDIKEFNCCGYPLRSFDFRTFVFSAARNLALAARAELDMIVLCKCCFGSLKKVEHLLHQDSAWRDDINGLLSKEGLRYTGDIEVRHLLSVLYHQVGLEAIKDKIEKPFLALKIAAHYGCHALRPSRIVQFDDPLAPSIFDQLVEATGAESISWAAQLECCGAPLGGVNDELSMSLTEKKLTDAQRSGAEYLCTACSYCQLQFDVVQGIMVDRQGKDHGLAAILYPQLLGLSLGIPRDALGFALHRLPADDIEKYLAAEPQGEAAEA